MSPVAVVEDGRYLHKLGQDLIVTGHVGGQNAAYDALANGAANRKKDILDQKLYKSLPQKPRVEIAETIEAGISREGTESSLRARNKANEGKCFSGKG